MGLAAAIHTNAFDAVGVDRRVVRGGSFHRDALLAERINSPACLAFSPNTNPGVAFARDTRIGFARPKYACIGCARPRYPYMGLAAATPAPLTLWA
jgi:hypothetical protein